MSGMVLSRDFRITVPYGSAMATVGSLLVLGGISVRDHRPARAVARTRDERGAEALEFALIIPLLVMLLLGIVSLGLTYSHGIGLSDAVREGSRFGATGISSSTWGTDVAAQVRGTQYDDSAAAGASTTSVCVQLWKYTTPGTNAGTVSATSCSPGGSGAPTLTMPGKDVYPVIPPIATSASAGTCVVRVLAARDYSVTFGIVPSVSGTLRRGAVARYERSTCS